MHLPFTGIASFCKLPIHTDLATLKANVAVLGVPYDGGSTNRPGARFGPRAVREASTLYSYFEHGERGYFDVEEGRRLLSDVDIVDAGDVDILPTLTDATFVNVTRAIQLILSHGAMPVVVGGDHSVTFPVVRAFDASDGPIDVVHLDAHVDYNATFLSVEHAHGNPMRHVHRLPFVRNLTQIGIRGLVVAERSYKDALERGVKIATARDVQRHGVAYAVEMIPPSDRIYVSFDVDVLDPCFAPGTGTPEVGGLSYLEVKEILRGIAAKGKVVGFDVMEVNPLYDPAAVTAQTAARLIIDFLGMIEASRAD